MNDGRLMFTTRVRDNTPENRRKKLTQSLTGMVAELLESEYTGKWLHLAARLDVENQVITHFVNGKVFSVHPIHPDYHVTTTRFGTGEIGNWGLPLNRISTTL